MGDVERWTPDDMLIDACRSGGRAMADLEAPDRCWAVAGMRRAGLTSAEIADLLDCSVRLVKAVAAEPMTSLCAMLQAETDHFADETRLLRSELDRARRAEAAACSTSTRLRSQIDRLLHPEQVDMCGAGLHEMTAYNTYVRPGNGRRMCRACHRERQADRRRRSDLQAVAPQERQPVLPGPMV